MRMVTKAEAQKLTAPCHDVWVDAHVHAWGLWKDRLLHDPEFIKPLTAPDRYTILHRHVCDHVSRHLPHVPIPRLDFFAQVLGGRVLVRFKHVGSELKPRNYPTDTQWHLDRQEFTEHIGSQLALDGFGPMTVLTVGYTLSTGEDELSQVVVVCRSPKVEFWYPIFGAAEATGDGIDVTPMPGMEPPGPRIVSRRPRERPETGTSE